jgi:hypothetical protein
MMNFLIGADCGGIDAQIQAIEIQHDHVFSSDNDPKYQSQLSTRKDNIID